MFESLNDLIVTFMDILLGWLLALPIDAVLFAVALGSAAILTGVRLFTTNQDLLKRCRQDKQRLRTLTREAGKRGEIIRLEYIVSNNEQNEGLLVLTKRIYLYSLPPREYDEPVEFIISEELTSFVLRFRSGGNWFETWDSRKNDESPDSVELVFSLGGTKYREYFNVYITEN